MGIEVEKDLVVFLVHQVEMEVIVIRPVIRVDHQVESME
jgi:hypothetical protein